MRLHLETTEAELPAKAPELLRQLATVLEQQAPDLAKALGQVADDQEQAVQALESSRPGERLLDDLLERVHLLYARRLQQMLASIQRVVEDDQLLVPRVTKGWVEVDEQVGDRLWKALGLPEEDLLEKAAPGLEGAPKAGHKYLRRVPYMGKDGRKHYRYFYHEAALGRQVQAGETVKLGQRALEVLEIGREGQVTFEEEGGGQGEQEGAQEGKRGSQDKPREVEQGSQPPGGRRRRTVSADEWATVLGEHYGQEVIDREIEKRAFQAVRAVTRHVPEALLADLKGETDEQRMADLQQRVPAVYERLQKAFKRAGIDPWRARLVVARSLERRGWEGEARAAAIGSVLTPAGAQLARRHVLLLDAAENLAGGRRVRARHVQAAVELLQGSPEKFVAEVEDVAARAEAELARLHQLLETARQAPPGEPGEPVGRLLQAAVNSQAVRKLLELAQAFPGLQDRAIPVAQQIVPQVVAEAPRVEPTTEGGPTQVFVAGEGGRPRALRAHYKLVEAHELQASHLPGEAFKANPKYPKDVQERAYHRDKQEQMKVLRNAQQLNPAFVANTNPDAVNGPPLVTAGGVVLGGNSRTMSMQRAYSEHPEKAKELQQFLSERAHEFGFKPEDVRALRNPMLVRVVDVPDEKPETLRMLVRQFNESFTQGMDPRTMQVAMGRKLDDRALEDMAGAMQPEETLEAFLGSSRAESFVQALYRAGVIDDRNSNQFVRKGTRQLNEDGKQLVGRMLVGRMVGDADLLSETRTKALESISGSVPAMVLARQAGSGFDLSKPLAVAMSALNTLQAKVDAGLMKPLDSKVSSEQLGHLVRNFLQDMFGEKHPVLGDDRAMAMLEVFVRRPGPTQMARVFREYARLAQQNPEGQEGLFGSKKSPAEVFRLAIEQATKGETKEAEEAKAARAAPQVKVQKRKIKPGEAEPAEDTGSSVPAAGVPEEQAAMFRSLEGEQGLLKAGGPYVGPKGGLWENPQHTRHWDPKEHQGKQLGLFVTRAPMADDSAQQVEAKQLPVDVQPDRVAVEGGAPTSTAEPAPHPGGGRQDAAAEGQQGEPEIWTVIGVEDLRPIDFWSGKRLPIPAHELRECHRCGRQHAVVYTMQSSKGRSAQVGSGCGPAMAGGEKFYDSESQRKMEQAAKKKQKATHLQKVLAWLDEQEKDLAEKHLRPLIYPGGEKLMVPSTAVDAQPGEMREVLRTKDGLAEMYLNPGSDMNERRISLKGAWVWRVVRQLMQKLQAKGSDWRWPAAWPSKAPGMDAVHAVEDRLTYWLRKQVEDTPG